jgi:hypothetical protein
MTSLKQISANLTEKEKIESLKDFEEKFPAIKDLMPMINESVFKILGRDINRKKGLKRLNENQADLMYAEEASIGLRLSLAIEFLTRENKRLETLNEIQSYRLMK